MLKLNLLPPVKKRELELAALDNLLRSLAVRFLILLIIFSLFLASILFCLSILLKEQRNLITIRKSDPQMKNLLMIEDKIKLANQVIERVDLKQQQMVLWAPLLEEITEIVPAGIYLTAFSYQKDKHQIVLGGWANHRENLLRFQKSLEENTFFIEVEAPLANLVKEQNIDFHFTLSLK